MLILNPSFQGEGQFYVYFLFYILIIQVKCLAFQFFAFHDIRMYISILTGVKNGLSTS